MSQKPVLPVKTILCPTDWSEPSLEAFELALRLARQQKAQLLLLHVVPPLQPVLGIAANAHFETAVRDEADVQLRELLARYQTPDVRAIVLVRTGEPAQEIARVAYQANADLIVMSTHGHSGWTMWSIGSVADGVLRNASCPVLTVGAGATEIRRGHCLEFPFREVMAPMDWSEASQSSAQAAVSIAGDFDACCLMLHVFEAPDCMEAEFDEELQWLERKREADEQFRFLMEENSTWRSAERLVECGEPADVIADVARSEGIDLIVMPRNSGQPGSQRIGAVSEATLRDAPCPVLMLPPGALAGSESFATRSTYQTQVARAERSGDAMRKSEMNRRVPA